MIPAKSGWISLEGNGIWGFDTGISRMGGAESLRVQLKLGRRKEQGSLISENSGNKGVNSQMQRLGYNSECKTTVNLLVRCLFACLSTYLCKEVD